MKSNRSEYERKLWLLFLKGDEEAYSEIYSIYANILFGYGMHFADNKELVKDCVQDVFIKLYTKRSKLQPVGNVKVYLLSMMRNTLFNLLKKEVEHYRIDSMEPVFHIDYPIEHAIIEEELLHEQKKKLERMMDMLTTRQKEIIYYRFVEELSYEDISNLMQMNYQSVRNLLHRTITSIRNSVETDRKQVI